MLLRERYRYRTHASAGTQGARENSTRLGRVALTGGRCPEKNAEVRNFPKAVVTVKKDGPVSAYPGTEPIHLKPCDFI